MTIDFGTALVVLALLASLVLTFSGGARALPAIALVVCLIEALSAFGVLRVSSPKLRIDVILAIALAVVGGVCWSRATAKAAVTAATVITLIGVIQGVRALHVFA